MIRVPILSGVYLIKCLPTEETYVGSSKNIHHRFAQHLSNRLQKWGHQYEQNQYELYLLEEVDDPGLLMEVEQKWLTSIEPTLNKHLSSGPPIKRGADSNAAIGVPWQYESVLGLAADGYSYKDIAAKTGLTEGVCKSILNGQSHTYLQEKFPDLWRTVLIIKRKIIILKHPNYGVVEFHGKSIRDFERTFNCTPGLSKVLTRARKTYNGWSLPTDEESKSIDLFAKSGDLLGRAD